MIRIDPASFVLTTALVGILVTGLLLFSHAGPRKSKRFLLPWIAGDLAATFQRLVDLAQPHALGPGFDGIAWLTPDRVLVLALGAVVLGAGLHAIALAVLGGRRIRARACVGGVAALTGVFCVAESQLEAIADQACLALATIGLASALHVALALPLARRFRGARLIVAISTGVAIAHLAIAGAWLWQPPQLPPLTLGQPLFAPQSILVIDFVVAIGLSFGFVLTLQGRLAAQIERLATVDPLTDALNRRGMMPALEREWLEAVRYRRPFSVALFDVDHFKRINDTFGHAQGDMTLVRLVECIERNKRRTDFLARWGGEEFLLAMPGTTGREARLAVDRIRAAIGAVPLSRGMPIVTVSAGVAALDLAGKSPALSGLLAEADRCVHVAKVERNCVVFGGAAADLPLDEIEAADANEPTGSTRLAPVLSLPRPAAAVLDQEPAAEHAA